MKALILTFLFCVTTASVQAQSSFSCGMAPFPPFGCDYRNAVCICDRNGCRWVWVGCK